MTGESETHGDAMSESSVRLNVLKAIHRSKVETARGRQRFRITDIAVLYITAVR